MSDLERIASDVYVRSAFLTRSSPLSQRRQHGTNTVQISGEYAMKRKVPLTFHADV
jgi:hypothetical protein